MGGVRAQFATAPNIQMSLYSIPFYAAFEERLGHPSGYRGQGYLFVATKPSHLAYLQTNQALQKKLGLKQARMVTREEIVAVVPQLRCDDILGGSFCPTDGFVDPYSVMVGFTAKACEQGATLWRSTEVTAIQRNGSGITGAETTRGPVSTRVVVNAAGPWAASAAALAGVELPVEPMRRMLIPTEPFDGVSHEVPMVIDMSNGFHFRPESLGFLLAWNDPEEKLGFNTNFEPSFIEKVLTRAADRVPCFENLAVNPKRAVGPACMKCRPITPRDYWSCAGGEWVFLRKRIQRTRGDAFAGDRKDHCRPDSARQDGCGRQRRRAESSTFRPRRIVARDGGTVEVRSRWAAVVDSRS